MKFGKMEGTPEEIKDFCENNGLNILDYLDNQEKPLGPFLFIVPLCFYVLFIILLTIITNIPDKLRTLIFLLGCGCSLWLSIYIQIHFKNVWAMTSIIICGIAIMLVALGTISPLELLKLIKN
ncbi:MAG: hypothetical protein ACE5KZ_12695 [Candidatus Scalinduaceae bacterium]